MVWTSSSNEIISVTPIGDDTATFTAGEIVSSATITAMVGGERDTLTISVVTQAVAATDIEIQSGNPLSILVDESGTLTALVTPANHTDGSTIWSSSEEAIVTIDSASGEYRGLAEGRATITATVGANNITDTITINVTAEAILATNIEIQGDDTRNIITTRTGTLSATVTPAGYMDGPVVWSSSEEAIVTIDSNGQYQGVAEGSAIITAMVGTNNVTDTITITVSNYRDDPAKVDDDGDGLIEILDLSMLHNMRYDLAGTSYKTNTNSDGGNTNGCPSEGCNGYELVSNLSFDGDGDGRTWSGSNGNYALDAGDSNGVYFNITNGGWEPIGEDFSSPFTAIFDGGGFTIAGLAIRQSETFIGMFGVISGNAHLRGLGLVGNLSDYTGSGFAIETGGLVGRQAGSSIITNCYVTGAVDGGGNGFIGGLVGRQLDTSAFSA